MRKTPAFKRHLQIARSARNNLGGLSGAVQDVGLHLSGLLNDGRQLLDDWIANVERAIDRPTRPPHRRTPPDAPPLGPPLGASPSPQPIVPSDVDRARARRELTQKCGLVEVRR